MKFDHQIQQALDRTLIADLKSTFLDSITDSVKKDDCMVLMGTFPANIIPLTLTDIPYGVVNRKSNGLRNLDKGIADVETFNLNHFIPEIIRITSGTIYVFCAAEQASDIKKLMIAGGLSTRLCIWAKTNPSPMNGQHMWLSGIECCVFGKKPKATFKEHCKSPVWHFPCGRNKIHPTEKPIKLLKYLIKTSSNEGDLVFDPCAGSGSTLLAAKELNRKYFGIEIDENYYNAIVERLK